MRWLAIRWNQLAGLMLVTGFVLLAADAASGGDGRMVQPLSAAPPDGAQTFKTYCASCHGLTAKGNGPAAVAMRVPPPDLTQIAKRNKGVFPAERVRQIVEGRGPAAHGERTMPVWGDVFSRRIGGRDPHVLIDAIVHYVDGIQERPGE